MTTPHAPEGGALAQQLFDSMIAEARLNGKATDALLEACGIDPRNTEHWPLSDVYFDYYDSSFEFGGVTPGWVPTSKQLDACWALGFAQCWINYTDGTEVRAARGYGIGAPTKRDHPRPHSDADRERAERARLAGMASEEDREMVSNLIAESIRCGMWNAREAPLHAKDCSDKADGVAESLLARLAAARGEAVEEAIRWAWANHERFHVDSEDEAVRDALAALLPRGPGASTGTGVGNG